MAKKAHDSRPRRSCALHANSLPSDKQPWGQKPRNEVSALPQQCGIILGGNRSTEVRPNGTVITASYDDQDRLLQYGDYTFTYTANGELISKCQGSVCQYLDYDVFGNLRHVISDNGMEIEYVIDGRNRRIGKKINGTLVQGFIYDDQLRIVAELDGNNQVVSRFIYADHINVPEVLEKGGRTYRILHDHLGSPRLVIDTQTGEVVQEMQYDAWGNITYGSNPGFQPFGFAGGLYDTHTKLLRFGARDYDPQVGRWTAKDPLGAVSATGQLYLYCSAAPTYLADPSRKWNRPEWILGGGSVENDCCEPVIVFAMGPPPHCGVVPPGGHSSGGIDWDFVVLPDGTVWKIGPGELDLGGECRECRPKWGQLWHRPANPGEIADLKAKFPSFPKCRGRSPSGAGQ